MTIPSNWRGFQQVHQVAGGFRVVQTWAAAVNPITANWSEIDIRVSAFAARADVLALIHAAGLTEPDLQQRGILKSVSFVNLNAADGDDLRISEWAHAAVGTNAAPDPSTAYLTAQAGGPVIGVELVWPTQTEQYRFQVRAANDGMIPVTASAQAVIVFDVPTADR